MKQKHKKRIDEILKKAYIKAAKIEAEAELEHSEQKNQLGYCHLFWATQKRILKEKYGIDWKTPAEENPHIMYD